MEGKGSFGFDAETGTYEDLMKAGIVDPTKVTQFALQNAASVAGLLMTTEAMVAEKPKKERSSAPTMPPEDMLMPITGCCRVFKRFKEKKD